MKSQRIIQLVNPHLDSSHPSQLVRVLPDQAISLGDDLTLAFLFPHHITDEPWPIDNPAAFVIDAKLKTPHNCKIITLREGDQLEVQHIAALLIWPIALEINLPDQRVQSLMLHIESTDSTRPLGSQFLQHRSQ